MLDNDERWRKRELFARNESVIDYTASSDNARVGPEDARDLTSDRSAASKLESISEIRGILVAFGAAFPGRKVITLAMIAARA